jgi:hypothetical protein
VHLVQPSAITESLCIAANDRLQCAPRRKATADDPRSRFPVIPWSTWSEQFMLWRSNSLHPSNYRIGILQWKAAT